MGEKNNARAGFEGFGLLDVFFLVGMRFLGVASKKSGWLPRKKSADVSLRFVWGRLWSSRKLLPTRMTFKMFRGHFRNIRFAGFGVNCKKP